jgi:tetratricopeptide (TPR) repeat protein
MPWPSSSPDRPRATLDRGVWLALGLLVVVLVGVYGRVSAHEFLLLDDRTYVTENPMVRSGVSPTSLRWALTAVHASNWHPLTWLSHMLDVELFGLDPAGHHVVNGVLHVLNAVLLFLALYAISGRPWPSLLVAALFALHPLRVESVAWVAERKDVLAGTFWMLTLWAYAAHARAPSPRRYLLMITAYSLGLLCKPMLVSLPLVLLLLDTWPLGRKGSDGWSVGEGLRLVEEKIPLLLLAAAVAAAALWSQTLGGATRALEPVPLVARLANAVVSTGVYLWKSLWPAGLAVHYPHPWVAADQPGSGLWLPALGWGVVLVLITVLVARLRFERPYLVVGWGWYLITLVPTLGLVQVGTQALADRYSYLPSIGLAIALAWSLDALVRARPGWRASVVGLTLGLLLAWSLASQHQVGYWRDSVTLLAHAVGVSPRSHLARLDYGVALAERGRRAEAEEHYRAARRLRPDHPGAPFNLGNLARDGGRPQEAERLYREALALAPLYPEAWLNLGLARLQRGDAAGALEAFEQAESQRPEWPDAWINRANTLRLLGRPGKALPLYERALDRDAGNPASRLGLAGALLDTGDTSRGLAILDALIRDHPELVQAHVARARHLDHAGRTADALTSWREVLRLDPENRSALRRLSGPGASR